MEKNKIYLTIGFSILLSLLSIGCFVALGIIQDKGVPLSDDLSKEEKTYILDNEQSILEKKDISDNDFNSLKSKAEEFANSKVIDEKDNPQTFEVKNAKTNIQASFFNSNYDLYLKGSASTEPFTNYRLSELVNNYNEKIDDKTTYQMLINDDQKTLVIGNDDDKLKQDLKESLYLLVSRRNTKKDVAEATGITLTIVATFSLAAIGGLVGYQLWRRSKSK